MKLNELKEDVRQMAYEKWMNGWGPETDWYKEVFIQKKEEGVERGFDIDDIEFSGFGSQGDGARWKGSIDVYKWLQGQEWWKGHAHWSVYGELVRVNEMEVAHVLWGSGRSCNEGNMRVYVDWSDLDFIGSREYVVEEGLFKGLTLKEAWQIIEPHIQTIEDTLLEAARDFAREIYRTLEEEYEYQTSEEAFADWAEANEVEFNEEGEWN